MNVYKISGYDMITDDLIISFVIPDNLTNRILEIIGSDYDGVSDYELKELTLLLLANALKAQGFKPDFELSYSIGPVT